MAINRVILCVPDMSCQHCVKSITEEIQKIDGIHEFNVALDDKQVVISYEDNNKKVVNSVIDALGDIGFTATEK